MSVSDSKQSKGEISGSSNSCVQTCLSGLTKKEESCVEEKGGGKRVQSSTKHWRLQEVSLLS